MGIDIGRLLCSGIRARSHFIPDLNKINRVKVKNKNVMKIPLISIIKKFLYSSPQYHWCPIVLIVKLESIDSSSIHDNKKILKKKIKTIPGRIIVPNPTGVLAWKQVIIFWTVFNIWELVIQYIWGKNNRGIAADSQFKLNEKSIILTIGSNDENKFDIKYKNYNRYKT